MHTPITSPHAASDRPAAVPVPLDRAAAERPSRRWWALAVIGLAQFMVILDVTVVNVALPSIAGELALGRAALTWVVTAYSLAFGGFMLLGGRLADVVGRRRTFIAGVTLFTLASLASGLASSGGVLVAARTAQGLGAALASPAALAILLTTFEGAERDRALGVWAALGAAGAAVGGVLGGALTSSLGWRWIFLLNLPAGVAVASSVGAVTRANATRRGAERLDARGAVLATAGVGLLIYGLVAAGDRGWDAALPLATVVAAAAVLALFVRAERAHPTPLLRLEILARRAVAAGTLLMLAASGLLVGGFFLTSLLLQRALGATALDTGLAFLPVALATAVGAHLGAHFVGRAGPRRTGVAAFALAAAGLAWLAHVPSHPRVLLDVLPGFVLAAVGIGAAFVVATSTALGSVADAEAGIAGGVVNTMHELGGALGVALASAAAARALGAGAAFGDVTAGFSRAYLAAAIVAALVALGAGRVLPPGRPTPSGRRHFVH